MTVAIVLEAESQIGPDLRWPLRIAAVKGGEAVVVVPAPGRAEPNTKEISLSSSEEQSAPAGELAAALRRALDVYVGEGRWTHRKIEEAEKEAAEGSTGKRSRRRSWLDSGSSRRSKIVSETLELVDDPGSDFLLLVTEEIQGTPTRTGAR